MEGRWGHKNSREQLQGEFPMGDQVPLQGTGASWRNFMLEDQETGRRHQGVSQEVSFEAVCLAHEISLLGHQGIQHIKKRLHCPCSATSFQLRGLLTDQVPVLLCKKCGARHV